MTGDDPPPLVSSPVNSADDGTDATHIRKMRRKKKSRKHQEQGWETPQDSRTGSRSKEKRQMVMMLIGGACLLLLIIAGVFAVMNNGNRTDSSVIQNAPTKTTSAPPATHTATPVRSESAFLAEAEPLAKKFMTAKTAEEIIPWVRNPETAAGRIHAFYPDGKITAPGMSVFNTTGEVVTQGAIRVVMVSSRDFEEMAMAFFESPDGLKIDWESWVGWSEHSWDNFRAKKPTDAALFRVTLSAVEYYNFAFSDESKWQSYQLISPDKNHSIYGYAEKDSLIHAKLKLPPDTKQTYLTLALKFPPNATGSNQVIIDQVIADGWILETEKPQ